MDDSDDLRAALPKLHSVCLKAADKHYQVFEKHPENYPYINEVDFVREFAALLLPSSDRNTDRVRETFDRLLGKLKGAFSACLSREGRTGKQYLTTYKRRIVRHLNRSDPALHSARTVASISSEADQYAAEWSRLELRVARLSEKLTTADPQLDSIIEIENICGDFSALYDKYFALNKYLAEQITSRHKSWWEDKRNVLAAAGFVLTFGSLIFSVVWWEYGSEISRLLRHEKFSQPSSHK